MRGGSVFIRQSAFDATYLKYIISKMTSPKESLSDAFYNSSYKLGPVVCVPKGTKEVYMSTVGWSLFSYIVEAERPEEVFVEDYKVYRVNGRDITLIQGSSEGRDISEKVTHEGQQYTLTAIGEKAYVKRLTNDYYFFADDFVIPSTITSIGVQAFATCKFGRNIISNIVEPFAISSNTFSEEVKASVPLYVPSGTKAKYQTTAGWDFANIVDLAESAEPLAVGEQFNTEMDGVVAIFVVNGDKTVTLNTMANVGMVEIPSTVTYNGVEYEVTSIGDNAFTNCTALTSLTIPASVTSIGEYNQEIKGETNVEIIPVSA